MSEKQTCAKCAMEVIDVRGMVVHVGGGEVTQLCRGCNWQGGQAGGFSSCPRCGDQTQLETDHAATL